MPSLAWPIFPAGYIVNQSFSGWVVIYVSLLLVCRVCSLTKDTRMYGWRFYVGTSLPSPSSVSCVGVIHSNLAVSLWRATVWVVWDFDGNHLAINWAGCNLLLVLEALAMRHGQLGLCLPHCFQTSFGATLYILGRVHCTRFPFYPLNASQF